jgi:hypothetical protein
VISTYPGLDYTPQHPASDYALIELWLRTPHRTFGLDGDLSLGHARSASLWPFMRVWAKLWDQRLLLVSEGGIDNKWVAMAS